MYTQSNKNIYINQSFCSNTTCSRWGRLPSGQGWDKGDKGLWPAELRGRDSEAGRAEPSGMRQGRAGTEARGRFLPLSPPQRGARGAREAQREEFDLGLAMAEHKNNPETSLTGPV